MSPLTRIPDEWSDEPLDESGEGDDSIPVNLEEDDA